MLHLVTSIASAFCGLYVGSGEPLHNGATQAVLAISEGSASLTLSPDYAGDAASFGLVVPVPAGTSDDDVRTVPAPVLARLGEYTAPRLVRYTCHDLYPHWWAGEWHEGPDPRFTGCTGGDVHLGCTYEMSAGALLTDYGDDVAEGVAVEERFTEGDYVISVLSATDSAGLLSYLADRGYVLDESASWALQTYIDQGLQFLVAEVALESAGETWLTPLRIDYPSADVVTVPIRLGTENAGEATQDLELHVIAAGQAAIANYPEAELDRDCMLEGTTDAPGFDAEYRAQLDATLAPDPVAWTTVHAWNAYVKCDPCPPSGGGLRPDDLAALGYPDDGPVVTRLHARWIPRPDLVDLVISVDGEAIVPMLQTKYVAWDEALVGDFRVCGEDDLRSEVSVCADEPGPANRAAMPLGFFAAAWLLRRRAR
jgi:hypothetical protein